MNGFRSLCGLLALIAACLAHSAEERPSSLPREAKPIAHSPGIHNLFALGTNVYSGSAPEGEAGFAFLRNLGVKTIISVDGATPEVDLARKYGMRYVHLPHGYDGISTDVQLKLAKAAEVLPRPIYGHCHHGKHRGPAAAAVICMAGEGWGPEQALAWLELAGTSTDYTGLYAAVRQFKKPGEAVLRTIPSDFPATAKVSGLVDAMVGIDESWENLTKVRAAGYQAPKNHPDIEPSNEAVILWEHYREAQRLPKPDKIGPDFMNRLKAAELEAKEAGRLLRLYAVSAEPDLRARLETTFDAMGRACASCHRSYRDVASKQE